MITAVRLLEYDKRKNHCLRTYTSGATGTKYTSGSVASPSAFRVVRNRNELQELSSFPQFEIKQFEDLDHLHEFVQHEMEQRARVGLPAVRAAVMGGPSGNASGKHVRPTVESRLPRAASGPPSDHTKTNTGRQPLVPNTKEDGANRADGGDAKKTEEKNEKKVQEPSTGKKTPPKKSGKGKGGKKTSNKKAARKRAVKPADNDK